MTSPRGLTLIEMLLALVLLTGIVLAVASWTSIAGRLGSRIVEPMRRQAVGEAVFGLIQEDLVSGDFQWQEAQQDAPEHDQMRVRVDDESLHIDTRASQVHVFRLDHPTQRLERIERSNGTMRTRALMTGVSEFTCAIAAEKRELEVTLQLAGTADPPIGEGTIQPQRFVRRFCLP